MAAFPKLSGISGCFYHMAGPIDDILIEEIQIRKEFALFKHFKF